jgi:hypothetical protein
LFSLKKTVNILNFVEGRSNQMDLHLMKLSLFKFCRRMIEPTGLAPDEAATRDGEDLPRAGVQRQTFSVGR